MEPTGEAVTAERLLVPDRHRRIIEELRRHGTVRVSALSERFGVSELTIRRDIANLAGKSLLTRVHGGATLVNTTDPAARPASGPTPPLCTIGMIVPSLDYYWPPIVAGARLAAQRLGAHIQLRGSSYDAVEDRRQISRLIETHQVDGLLLAPNLDGDVEAVMRWIAGLPIPTILVEREPPRWTDTAVQLESVRSDHALGLEMAVRHLHGHDHRRIGLVLSKGSPTSIHLERGWALACRDLGIPEDLVLRASIGLDVPGHRAVISALLDRCRATDTTALIVHSDPDALSILQYCAEHDITVPRDLAVVSYDDEVAELAAPALTAVRPPKHHVGRLAVEMMVARLTEGAGRPHQRVLIMPALHVRASSVVAPGDVALGSAAPGDAATPGRAEAAPDGA